MENIFYTLKGYEGYYEISKEGVIRSLDRKVPSNCDLNGRKFNHFKSQILKQRIDRHGYLVIQLCKDGIYKRHFVHRLIAETFINNENDLPIVNHMDGNTLNNQINNLEWCSYSHNIKHAYDNELRPKVSGRNGGVIPYELLDIIEILCNLGLNKRDCIEVLKIPKTTFMDITSGKCYSSINNINKDLVFKKYRIQSKINLVPEDLLLKIEDIWNNFKGEYRAKQSDSNG